MGEAETPLCGSKPPLFDNAMGEAEKPLCGSKPPCVMIMMMNMSERIRIN